MTRDITLGILIVIFGLGGMTSLILWSRKTIQRIAKMESGSLREIMKELHHGRQN
jgi:hypothetical protein